LPRVLEGDATWYGQVLQGHHTASSERFDMYSFTAAQDDLPFGSIARVTNLRNGRSVLVRINDREVGAPGRIIDLSYAGARKLGMLCRGVAPVRIELLYAPRESWGAGRFSKVGRHRQGATEVAFLSWTIPFGPF
jgi:rare lipoprotein A